MRWVGGGFLRGEEGRARGRVGGFVVVVVGLVLSESEVGERRRWRLLGFARVGFEVVDAEVVDFSQGSVRAMVVRC